MSQTTQTDIITLGDVATRLPNFITKVPHILNGLKQAYLRTPTSPAGLGIAFEKAVKRMLPGGPLSRKQMTNLRVYKGESHPHEGQTPEIFNIKDINEKNSRRVR